MKEILSGRIGRGRLDGGLPLGLIRPRRDAKKNLREQDLLPNAP